MPGCVSKRLLQSKSPHLANGGSHQLGEDGRAWQPKVGADRTKGCGGRVGVLPSSVQQGASQLQLHVFLGPSRSLSVEAAGCLVCRCVGLLRDGLRTFG